MATPQIVKFFEKKTKDNNTTKLAIYPCHSDGHVGQY